MEQSLINRLKPLEMWRPESVSRIQFLEGEVTKMQVQLVALAAKLESVYPPIDAIRDVPGRIDEVEARVKGFASQIKELAG